MNKSNAFPTVYLRSTETIEFHFDIHHLILECEFQDEKKGHAFYQKFRGGWILSNNLLCRFHALGISCYHGLVYYDFFFLIGFSFWFLMFN